MNRLLTILVSLSATWLLFSCADDGNQMRLQLEHLERDNRADSLMTNDSLAEELVQYFDEYGTPNEQMRARYILGRTYFDMGEMPRALETYLKAADCVDTTNSDCDYAVLSRIHAQSAAIFHQQVQFVSESKELEKASYFAKNAHDTLMAIECYALKAGVYDALHQYDSVVIVVDSASERFRQIGREDRVNQVIGWAISPLIKQNQLLRAKQYIDRYEALSGFFDEKGNVAQNQVIYYYIKGEYFLATNQLDSAEILFRKELAAAWNLNHQIAGCKGLQDVFARRGISDSIAKYAQRGYLLNDSAYSLSEMESIQRLKTSYNYHNIKLQSVENARKAERAYKFITIIISLIIMIALILFCVFSVYRQTKEKKIQNYQRDLELLVNAQTELQALRQNDNQMLQAVIEAKNRELEEFRQKVEEFNKGAKFSTADLEAYLQDSDIVKRMRSLLAKNPPQQAFSEYFRELRKLINEVIPSFYSALNTSACTLRPIEYEVCLLIRVHFAPAEICKLTGRSDAYISNLRKAILQKVFGVMGTPKDLDTRILSIS